MPNIPMRDLRREYEYMKDDIDAAIAKCLQHQRWILGPEVEELESAVAQYLGVQHCVGVSSGTDALVLSLRALAIKTKGQEYFDQHDTIITTPFTFTATGEAILRARATPVFVDIDPRTYNIDPLKIKDYLESDQAQSAVGILPVHLFGQACDMDAIMKLAEEYNLFVVEDVAQALGGKWKEKKLGAFGHAAAFSFFPSKNLGAMGDAGLVATHDNELAELVRVLLNHGGKDKYNAQHLGYNARLDTIQAAVLTAKLHYIDELNERRRKIADYYNEQFARNPNVSIPTTAAPAFHVYHQYSIIIRKGNRKEIKDHLRSASVGTAVYYPTPLHQMGVFCGRFVSGESLQHSEQVANSIISLPIEPLLPQNSIDFVVATTRSAFN